jgi:prepilin-type N-terminal cleavage/methylation domain-containing protein
MQFFRLRAMKQTTRQNQKGFTLAELLVAMSMSLIVLGAVSAVYRVQSHTVKAQEYRMEAQEYARVALDMMVREIRNLGYFPVSPNSCPGTKGLISASGVSIQFVYDFDFDGACTTSGENITYAYDANSKNISRNGQPLADGNITAFQMTYYPRQTGAAAPAPYCISGAPTGCSGTLDLTKVQRISVSLTVQSKSTDTKFGGLQTIRMDSNADLRNHF